MTGICLTNEKLYLDERIQKIVLDNFQGISFAGFQEGFGFYSKNKDKLKKSLSLNGSVMDENLRCYIDEPISTPTNDNKHYLELMNKYPNVVIGETLRNIYFVRQTSSICLTTYSNCLISSLWKLKLVNLFFGKKQEYVWIHITKDERVWTKILNWCKENNKKVILYVPPEINKYYLILLLKKFGELCN